MRPIAITTALLLIGVFPSPTASQTNPYQPGNVSVQMATHRGAAAQATPARHAVVPELSAAQASTARMARPVPQTATISPHDEKDGISGMKLGPSRDKTTHRDSIVSGGPGLSILTIASSLAVVIGIFLIVAWLMRRATPRANRTLPGEVVEVLGRAALTERQYVHLLRCGGKLLLVSVTPTGSETLTEITAADEVARLTALCRQEHPGSSTASFRQVFQQLSRGGMDE